MFCCSLLGSLNTASLFLGSHSLRLLLAPLVLSFDPLGLHLRLQLQSLILGIHLLKLLLLLNLHLLQLEFLHHALLLHLLPLLALLLV